MGADGKTNIQGSSCGRQVWRPQGKFIELPPFSAAENPNAADILYRRLISEGITVPSCEKAKDVHEALKKGVKFYEKLQVNIDSQCLKCTQCSREINLNY